MFNIFRLWGFWIFVLSLLWNFLARPAQQNLELLAASDSSNVLLLTAHPDDECMFFAPTLLSLFDGASERRPTLYSLCLSVGNADGLGAIRQNELAQSLDVLGIGDGRRWVIDNPYPKVSFLSREGEPLQGSPAAARRLDRPAQSETSLQSVPRDVADGQVHLSQLGLQDNFTVEWDAQLIADVLQPYVIDHQITTILTFDERGISSHPNHISLPRGAARLLNSFPTSKMSRPRLFTLVTVPLHEKYLGLLSPALSKACISWSMYREDTHPSNADGSRAVAVSGWAGYARAHRAMRQHQSQLVWFRWLYVSFSHYMWVNEWVELLPESNA